MITLKKMDVYGQLFLILGSLAVAFSKISDNTILCYFIVGGWQVLSTAVHLSVIASNKPQIKDRKAYNVYLLIATLTLPIGSY